MVRTGRRVAQMELLARVRLRRRASVLWRPRRAVEAVGRVAERKQPRERAIVALKGEHNALCEGGKWKQRTFRSPIGKAGRPRE